MSNREESAVMRSFALNSLILVSMMPFLVSLGFGECKCTCRPSPPGGVTKCERGQIAVCGDDGRGTCEGSCLTTPNQIEPLEFARQVLTSILKIEIPSDRMRGENQVFADIIDSLLKSHKNDETVTFSYKGREFKLSVGLTDNAVTKLEQARDELSR